MNNTNKFQGAASNSDAHARQLIRSAEQIRERYRKVGRIILDHLKIKEYQWEKREPLEDHLNLKNVPNPAITLIENKIQALPTMGLVDTKAISFERIKELSRLSPKLKVGHRNTNDVYGLQLWLDNPDHITIIAKDLENPQSELFRKLKDKVHGFENFFNKPKKHGYSALHLDIKEGTGKFTAYGEIQIMPVDMMLSYLSTRDTYTAYREIEEYVIKHYDENEDEWPETERTVVEALRLSIKSRYEADLYACGLMGLRDPYHKHQASFNNETEARKAANALQNIADGLTLTFLSYSSDIDSFMHDIENIAQPYMDHGLHMSGHSHDRYLDISALIEGEKLVSSPPAPFL